MGKHLLALVALALSAASCTSPNDPAPPATDSPAVAPTLPSPEVEGTLLITGGRVVTLDAADTVLENGAVAVVGHTIEAIGPADELAARYPDARVLSAEGGAILPGLINAHTHVPMTLFRGLADDLPLMRWLQEVIFPAEAEHVDEEMVRWGTRLACLEMIRTGTTTFVDMYYYEDAIAEETDACGLRAVLGETLIDFPAPDNKTWDEAVAYTDRFLETWKDHPRIVPAVAPHAVYTVSAEHLKTSWELAAKHDVPVLIHLAEHPSEMESVAPIHPAGPIDYLHTLGLLDDRTVAAHVVLPTEADIRKMAELDVGAVHCPQSNMKLGAGVSPVPRMMEAGMAVGLGTDGAASNNDLNLWEEIDTAAKLHKLHLSDPTAVTARQALWLATLGGARALDLEDRIGSLEVGKRADVVVVSLDQPHQQPVYDVHSVLAYATKGSDVRSVVVDGRVLLEEGRFLTLDPEEILAKVREYRELIGGGSNPATE